MKKRFKIMTEAMKRELQEHRSSFLVFCVLRVLVILVIVRQFFNGNYENVFLGILTLLLLFVPSLIQVSFKIELPTTLEIIIMLFIFSAEILGEIHEFYIIIPFWDTILHTLNGFLAAAIGFSMVVLLNDNKKIMFNLSPVFLALVAFCFSMTIGVVWEFFEFAMDRFFLLDMQKDTVVHTISSVLLDPKGGNTPYMIENIGNVMLDGRDLGLGGYLDIGLIDTMKDLLVNFVGAVCFSFIGFFYVKKRGRGGIVSRFVPSRKSKDRDYLEAVKTEWKKEEGEP
ncbi:MAG: hypothetical protein ACOX8H_12705 [Ruminococcus sp.]